MPIKTIAVDHDGLPISSVDIDLELYRFDWNSVKKKNVDGAYYWENTVEETLVDSTSVKTGSDGMESHDFIVDEGGSYMVRATSTDSLGNEVTSTVRFYATTRELVHWQEQNNNTMELELDQLSYDVGDTAKVLVQSPYTDIKALLTYERGDIIESKVIDITTNTDVIEILITEEMIPNFYVSVLAVSGGDSENPPDFRLGYENIVVDATNKNLLIDVSTDSEKYEPQDIVELNIKTTDIFGNPKSAEVSIAVVDESLLALKANPIRDLVSLFYNRRNLGVLTSSNLTNLLERISLSDIEGTKGGSGKGATKVDEPRGEFEDTAFWRSVLTTDASGNLTTSFTLPDNLTTWNIEVIGLTDDSLFGATEHEIISQKAVMLRPVLPLFARYHDELELGAIVHNLTDSSANFTVELEATNLELTSSTSQTVNIEAGESEKVYFSADVPKVDAGTFAELTLSVSGSGESDAVIQKFPIYSYSTPETVATSSYTEDVSFTEEIYLPESIDPSLGELEITTGATLATYLSDGLNYLLSYPYHCTEQVLSSLVPNVIIKNSISLPNLSDKLELDPIYDSNGDEIPFDTMVKTSLQKLYANQRADGGWGYWSGSKYSYPSVSSFAVFGLTQIQNAGYSIDNGTLKDGISYLEDYMNNNEDLKTGTGDLKEKTSTWANKRAFMLFALSESGHGDLGLSNSLYEDRELLSTPGKTYLAMTLFELNGGSNSKVEELIQDLENALSIDSRGSYIPNDEGRSFTMMTSTKATALAIQALTRIEPDHVIMPRLISWLIASRHNGHWDTTQDNMTALIALTEYLETSRETDAEYHGKISVNDETVLEYNVDGESILDREHVVREISDLSIGDESNSVIFNKDGIGRLYYDLVLRYFLPIDEIKSRDEGFIITRNYYSLDDEELETPLSSVTAGETVHGKITVIVPEERNLVAVEAFLPAGFELINFDFDNVDDSLNDGKGGTSSDGKGYYGYPGYYFGSSPWTETELRHDRLLLFADDLDPGVYEYDYFVQATSEGTFHHPPALVYEMYFPENFGRTTGEYLEVQ